MSENAKFKIGGITSPVTSSTTNHPLQDADPVLYYMQRFYKNVLRIHIGERFAAERSNVGLSEISSNNCVAENICYNPLPISSVSEYKFPLMCTYRTGQTFKNTTIQRYSLESNIEVLWILEPLTPRQYDRLNPLINRAGIVLVERTEQSFDENYNSGQDVWSAAGIESIKVGDVVYGKFSGLNVDQVSSINLDNKNSIFFPGLLMSLAVSERLENSPADNFDNLNGIDVTYDLGESDGYYPSIIEQINDYT